MNETSESQRSDWPYDSRSDQVHAEQLRDRERVQQDVEAAFQNLLEDAPYYRTRQDDPDIKLLKWALGVK